MLIKKNKKTVGLIVFTWFWLLLLLFPVTLSAKEENTILLINSNAAVGKYKIVQEEFKKAVSGRITEIDLQGNIKRFAKIKKMSPSDVDIVYCIGSKAYHLAKTYYKNNIIVFSSIINWRRLGVTPKTYGVSNELLTRMQFYMFRAVFPGIKKIGVMYSMKYNAEWFEKANEQASLLGIELVGGQIRNNRQSISTLKKMSPDIDALWLISDPLVIGNKKTLFNILRECDKRKKPVFSYHKAFARPSKKENIGAVLIVSADNPTIGRQAAGIAMNLTAGKQNEEKKIQHPAGSHLTLNLKKVKAYGLAYEEKALKLFNDILQ